MIVLVLNAGSSSEKSCLYRIDGEHVPEEPPVALWSAQIDWNEREGTADLRVKTAARERREKIPVESREEALDTMLETIWEGEDKVLNSPAEIDVVGHRVVHGGTAHRESAFVTPEMKASVRRLFALAPIHNPANLEGIEHAEILVPRARQVAVFDTAFHSTIPESSCVYPGPYEWFSQGIRRYGFHGISHQYCAQRASTLLGRPLEELKMVTCHLGSGCSLAAIRDGRCIDTTMGFTPLDGIMMGSRCGALDPGIILYLLREKGLTVERVDRMLNKEAGLYGISGLTGDMRKIIEARNSGHVRAKLAFDLFMHRFHRGLGALIMSLGGLDVLVFTAGIGENSPEIVSTAVEPLKFLGVELDPELNDGKHHNAVVSVPSSRIKVMVIHTQEDWAIARECVRMMRQAGQGERAA